MSNLTILFNTITKGMWKITITKIFLSLITLSYCSNLRSSQLSGRRVINTQLRMIGGDDASLYEYTFMAVLVKYNSRRQMPKTNDLESRRVENNKGRLVCGGAIIHKDWILTSARCITKDTMELFEIYAGIVDIKNDVGQQIRTIQNVSIHPNYKESSDEFNIAMIKVSSPFLITTHVRAGYLPVGPLEISGTERCHILGFVVEYDEIDEKEKSSERLIKVQLHAIDYNECLHRNSVLKAHKSFGLTSKNYCLVQIQGYPNNNSQGACKGDVGGPCVCGFKVQGIIAHYTSNTCFKVGYPTTITDVGHHLNWIRQNILQLNVVTRNVARPPTSKQLKLVCLMFLLINEFR